MEPNEIDVFVNTGQSALTLLARASEDLKRWADSFEQRGGTPVYGNDATLIVYMSNDLEQWLTPERRATIANLRNDL